MNQFHAEDAVAPTKRSQALTSWRVKDFDVGRSVEDVIASFDHDATDWLSLVLPGDIYLALHAAGRLPDPFGDRAEAACAWVRDREWWWLAEFAANDPNTHEQRCVTFEGLDTFATVWLDGVRLGDTNNMFRAWTFDLGRDLAAGNHRLLVCFSPTALVLAGKEAPAWPVFSGNVPQSKRNWVRKAQFGWGWDWGPDLPTVGIWKPVWLQTRKVAAIESVAFQTIDLSPLLDRVRLKIDIHLESYADSQDLEAVIELIDADGRVALTSHANLQNTMAIIKECTIENPRLWWTCDRGDAHLYTLRVVLKSGTSEIDRHETRVGIRTIVLDTSLDPDELGAQFFRFVLNGVPLFARGACWIPASSFVGALEASHYRRLLESTVNANMNMVRVWGGGIYEHDAFYALCDELGLLVWQDFMFACARYPEHDDELVQNVKEEIRYQIARLRHHASLALWCGNNESQLLHDFAVERLGHNGSLDGSLYYNTIMPAAVAELDPTTAYWPGSPTGGPHPNSMLAGDLHNWTVWHGVPPVPGDRLVGEFDRTPDGVSYTRYAEDNGRFISEFGIQASPVMETLRRALPDAQRFLNSEGLLNRIKDHPKDKIDAMLLTVTGLPGTLEQYVDLTQITQAEGLKFGIEHFRRRMPHCSGTLIWQYNDCWPGISWSLVDYYGFGKASYYYTQRAYAPVLASFKAIDHGKVELWITNDTAHPFVDEIIIDSGRFDTGVLTSSSLKVQVPAHGSQPVWCGPSAYAGEEPDRYLCAASSADLFPINRLFFAPIKDLRWNASARPAVMITAVSPHELHVHIVAAAYLYLVHLLLPCEWTRFSDNYFDMQAGEARTITVRNDDATLLPGALQVLTGNDVMRN